LNRFSLPSDRIRVVQVEFDELVVLGSVVRGGRGGGDEGVKVWKVERGGEREEERERVGDEIRDEVDGLVFWMI